MWFIGHSRQAQVLFLALHSEFTGGVGSIWDTGRELSCSYNILFIRHVIKDGNNNLN